MGDDDDEVGGLQVYVVAASRRPLPVYQEWQSSRGAVAWRKLQKFTGVWQADPLGTYPAKAGVADRGSLWKDASVPPLAELCQALQVGGVQLVQQVELIAPRGWEHATRRDKVRDGSPGRPEGRSLVDRGQKPGRPVIRAIDRQTAWVGKDAPDFSLEVVS